MARPRSVTRGLAQGATCLGVLYLSACGSGPQAREAGVGDATGVTIPLASTYADAPGVASWTPWPQAMHDAQHTNASTSVGPRHGEIRWTRALEGNVTPGPVVGADGTIYAASNAGVLHALDPATGEDRWVVDGEGSYGVDTSTSPAVLPSGTILWPGPRQRLFALSPDGEPLWDLELSSRVTSPAVLADGRVVVGDDSGRVLLLEPDVTGPGTVWEAELGELSFGSPIFSPKGDVVYQTVTSGVVAMDATDGTVLWRSDAPKDIVEVSSAVGPDGTVVVGTNDPFQYGLDPRSGEVAWRFRRDFWTYSSPGVTADGIAYFGDHDNRITGLDVATGEVVFRVSGSRADKNPGGIGIWTSVAIDARHSAYAGNRDGLVYAVDRDGDLLWEIRAGTTIDSYPALTADGGLVIGTVDGDLLYVADR